MARSHSSWHAGKCLCWKREEFAQQQFDDDNRVGMQCIQGSGLGNYKASEVAACKLCISRDFTSRCPPTLYYNTCLIVQGQSRESHNEV